MAEEVKKSTKFTIGCMSWSGVILSMAIIAIRAFQPGAQPIESWSAFSWCMMLLPVIFPSVFWTSLIAIWFVAYILLEAFKK